MSVRKQNMIKEALDNLPMGVSFFNENGVPLLVNRTMHTLIYALNSRDLQSYSELENILGKPDEVFSGDGRVWRFRQRKLDDTVTEVTAADITELCQRKRELMQRNAEQREIMERLETVSRNVVSITRSEEILSMKMKVHNDLGYVLSSTRRFISSEMSGAEKQEFIRQQREMTRVLLNETANDDEPSVFEELKKSASKLGMEIELINAIPSPVENIMTKVVRECLVNAVRHANGDRVTVASTTDGNIYRAVVTNNGNAPDGEIVEGGGFSGLRKTIEGAGGAMRIRSAPAFSLTVELPVPGKETL